MRYWWVNQNKTYKYEVSGGFLWSPKTRSGGGRNHFYDNMKEVSPGDIVFSYCKTFIKAIGVVQSSASTAPKPDFEGAGSNWSKTGWFVEVEFVEITDPIKPKEYMELITPLLAVKYAPIQTNGRGKEIVYLAEISKQFADLLMSLSKVDISSIEKKLTPQVGSSFTDEEILQQMPKSLEGDLEKSQWTKSRRGQGVFKSNVRLVEQRCRVTGLSDMKHLRASHIKPWKYSDNNEKLDRYNGLLLSPHIDHLFDQGFISFNDEGFMMVSTQLEIEVLDKWLIDPNLNVGMFTLEQCQYLRFHRENIFKN